MNDIRKISIGNEVKDKAMHYLVGQSVLNNSGTICVIKQIDNGDVLIYVQNASKETFLWKKIGSHMPFSIEYNINF